MPTVGVDLGGTKIYAVRHKSGEVAGESKTKTPVHGGPLAVVDAIAEVVRELAPDGDRLRVGVGAPGVVDVDTGVVRNAPNLPGWMEPFPLGPSLSEALGGADVVVENDVNVATIAEHSTGSGENANDMLCVFVGTGVGGGVVLAGALRRGGTGLAGEIGHVIVHPRGRQCGCGGLGHLEAYAGRAGMERRARELDGEGEQTTLVEIAPPGKRMTSSVWAKALDGGDRVAGMLLDEAVEALGIGIAGAVVLLDIPLVVVGGGLADRLGPSFVGRVDQAVRSRVFGGRSSFRLVPAALGDRAGALGAALAARQRF